MSSSRAPIAGRMAVLLPLLAACAAPNAYAPPPVAQTTEYSRDLNASFDQVWSAVTFVAGSTFFNIKNFDKGSGLMTLDYSNLRGGPGPYVTCGTFQGALPPIGMITPEPNSVLNNFANVLQLSGRANITVRARGNRRTTVQINSIYDMNAVSGTGNYQRATHWQFTSREADTQPVQILFQRLNVTCRPSYKLESDFLTEVAARL